MVREKIIKKTVLRGRPSSPTNQTDKQPSSRHYVTPDTPVTTMPVRPSQPTLSCVQTHTHRFVTNNCFNMAASAKQFQC